MGAGQTRSTQCLKDPQQARGSPSQAVNKGHILESSQNGGERKDSGLDPTVWHMPRGAVLAGIS